MNPIRPTTAELRAGEAAAWGPRPPGVVSRERMRILSWRPVPVRKGALVGFLTVQLGNGLRLIDCPVLISSGKAWCSLPSKPQIDRDGRQIRDANGRPAYAQTCQWDSRDLNDRWSQTVIALLRQARPGALEGTSDQHRQGEKQ
jgi:hypothetical protein